METVRTHFENSESVFMSENNRKTQRKKRERKDRSRTDVHRYTSKRFQNDEQDDRVIQVELDKSKIVNILYDSSR